MGDKQGQLDLSVSNGTWTFSAAGETQVVLDAYEDFKQSVMSSSTPEKNAKPKSPASTDVGKASKAPEPVKNATTLPLKPYLKRLKLGSNKEKATAIIAWAGESGHETPLTIAEIEKLWKKTPFKAASNLRRDVRDAENEGWLDSEGKSGSPDKTYSINGYGEDIVAGWIDEPSE
jgi:hypothetical protein